MKTPAVTWNYILIQQVESAETSRGRYWKDTAIITNENDLHLLYYYVE
jgi:hypothetical protein